MKYSISLLLIFTCILLSACSGWVEHQQYRISETPFEFDNSQAIRRAGYHLSHSDKSGGNAFIVKDTYSRFRYPKLTVFTLSDGSIIYLFWDSGVPPFEMHSPNFKKGVTNLFDALQQQGVKRDLIQPILLEDVPK